MDEIPEGICIVCGHKLSSHVEELRRYRCHSLGPDGLQCECNLYRIHMLIDKPVPLDEYDLKKRMEAGPLKELIDKLEDENNARRQ